MTDPAGRPNPQPDPSTDEGWLIRLVAPAHRSRPRLLLLAVLFVAWVAFLIGLYLSTPRPNTHPTPSATTLAMAFPR